MSPYMVVKRDEEYCVYHKNSDGEAMGDSLGCHPNKAEAQSQIAAIWANETKELWVTEDKMRLLCPECADEMVNKGLTRINLAAMKQEGLSRLCDRFDFSDPGWFTSCVDATQDYSWVDDPESLCARLHKHCLGFWPGEHEKEKGTDPLAFTDRFMDELRHQKKAE